jgi:FMN phosphatase YigB (HAD superfamily)
LGSAGRPPSRWVRLAVRRRRRWRVRVVGGLGEDDDAAFRVVGDRAGVLTNTEAARSLIAAADLPDLDPVVGTNQVRAFKPDRRVYEHCVEASGRAPGEVVLITAHGWDAVGAKRAGDRERGQHRRQR